MDPKYEDLELDAVEEGGAGRVWQEMEDQNKNSCRVDSGSS